MWKQPRKKRCKHTARQKEIITLEAEDMPVELDGEGYICVTCYEIIPKAQYASHRSRRDCHSPARPPEAKQERNLSCSTCHQTFRNKKAMISTNLAKSQITTPAEPKSKQQPKGISSAIAAEIRQRDVRDSTRAASTIAA